jgi:hypothetical protein
MAKATIKNMGVSSVAGAAPPVVVIKLPIGKNSVKQALSHGK